ncbi:MAG: S49 family peptidase [Alphaproteobacteria bacterium]|jgi:signal peptide peptidase SppA|nr:S49 family peptidase [Alphaproteobacteria bacterium]MDP6270901.1 S49 family peptidase [Alphaproteobacteria bacterium]MDP7164906.1 S49 family peptidase [Alphaproteobacteria bacterium]MDP7428549.1 S49 family peptidase [Alphaproteobacteria bacterium]
MPLPSFVARLPLGSLWPLRRWRRRPVVAVVRLDGVIGRGGRFREGLDLATLARPLETAFGLRRLAAMALAINSPGGAATQSNLIYKHIRALAEEHEVPVLAFAEDLAASGGYWLACAGDEIFADENSIVGSVGVIFSGFGFTGLMEKLGVERRLHTAGEKKSLLDPFSEEKAADVKRLAALQKDIHESFKELVRQRRGERLKGGARKIFSGDIWSGRQALELGLIDGLGDLRSVCRERFGEEVKFRQIGAERRLLRRLLGRGNLGAARPLARAPAGWADELIAAIEDRALWGRFGL